jgi:hypothetical protein
VPKLPLKTTLPQHNVLILTPMKNAGRHVERYVELIESLDWPRAHLSIGILESDSDDGTFEYLGRMKDRLDARAQSAEHAHHKLHQKATNSASSNSGAHTEISSAGFTKGRLHNWRGQLTPNGQNAGQQDQLQIDMPTIFTRATTSSTFGYNLAHRPNSLRPQT